ncbi:MAG TPA: hypothetical protein EYP85_01590 [Armatimonadetes bacterium]|nr:hypothetical protein [Armatimonadota bacterium]
MKESLLDRLHQPPPTLIVSLPRNSVELAQAAVDGGAEVLKVHLNLRHAASGLDFGPLAEERERLQAILEAVEVPVGIVLGGKKVAPPEDLTELADLGFAFFDVYAHHAPAWLLEVKGLLPMFAIDDSYSLREVKMLEALGMQILEAAIVPPEGYGQPLTVRDVCLYGLLTRTVSVPVVVPTQRYVSPREVGILAGVGVHALMIGAIVTGTDAHSLERTTRAFRQALRGCQ